LVHFFIFQKYIFWILTLCAYLCDDNQYMADSLLLQVSNLHKVYGSKVIFDGASVSILEKQKIGVIGRNGAGKSTLFKMIMGHEECDSGEVMFMPELRLGYIPQQDPFEVTETVIGFLQRFTDQSEWECAKVAGQFQLKGEMLNQQIGSLSGGYQMRVKLASTLLFEPNLLLLDEPTNYLDLSTLLLLEKFLQGFRGGFLCITHDREFLKRTCTSTMEVEHGKIVLHPEPLEQYLEFKEEQLNLAIQVNKNILAKQKQLQTFVDRFGAKASMAKSAQSKAKVIDKLEDQKVSISKASAIVKMWIPSVPQRDGTAVETQDMSIGYEHKIIASGIDLLIEKGQKVAILGDNGQGKSTLLKTIAGILPVISGSLKWSPTLEIAFYAQHINQSLPLTETIESYLKSKAKNHFSDEQIKRMMSNFLFSKNDAVKTINVLSGGEKARLCLAGMFLTQPDVLLLDEPTNHLDFSTVEAMAKALSEFSGTVFVISHDRTFVNIIANQIWEVQGGKVKKILGTYQDYIWQKEQDLGFTKDSGIDKFADEEAPKLDKAERIRQHQLRKDIQKIERKIASLKSKLESNPFDNVTIGEIEKLENNWLEMNELARS
jgi:ATP-binding cassette, subfamily F, member 3